MRLAEWLDEGKSLALALALALVSKCCDMMRLAEWLDERKSHLSSPSPLPRP